MKGLLMTPDNAQKCHDGTKTQTRRLIKPQPYIVGFNDLVPYRLTGKTVPRECEECHRPMAPSKELALIKCPFSVGDEVYIKETHYRYGEWIATGNRNGVLLKSFHPHNRIICFTNNPPTNITNGRHVNKTGWHKRPSLFLPADLARTIVTIKEIRAPRVQDISPEDCLAEGVALYTLARGVLSDRPPDSRWKFIELWDSIHGSGAWERNDFVWKYSFRRIEQ